jgi:hypothetical protein
MGIPPGLELPRPFSKFCDRRYVHFREGFTKPNAQPPLEDIDEGTFVVSGILLRNLVHALCTYKPQQKVRAYVFPNNPSDAEMVGVTQLLDMQVVDHTKNKQTGYTKDEVRLTVQARVGELISRIQSFDGASH